MDEQCRKDLPPAPLTAGFPISTEGARRLNDSPQKSVRFTEDEEDGEESKVEDHKLSRSGSSKRKKRL